MIAPEMRRLRFLLPVLVCAVISCAPGSDPAALEDAVFEDGIPAFPGAEGFGAYARGGRGGTVHLVTSLEDYPRGEARVPGTLRAAIEAEGPRIVVFQVSGAIELKSTLVIRKPYVTIAGQSAPGEGIQLKNYGILISTNDVVVRYLRIRTGDETTEPGDEDAISISNARNVIIDHCSTNWSTDENISVTRDSDNITVQWSISSEGLVPHSCGSLIGAYEGNLISFHHNLFTSNITRNPKATGWPDEGMPSVDFRNNVIYNWGSTAGYSGRSDESVRVNLIGNYLKPGPSTEAGERKVAFRSGSTNTHLYVEGNILDGFPEGNEDNWKLIQQMSFRDYEEPIPGVTRMEHPFATPPIQTDNARTAFERVLEKAGAVLPVRDSLDARIVDEVRNGAGRIIESQTEVGGWPEYRPAEPEVDSDGDGMPDWWEIKHGLDPHDPSDANLDNDGDGYTHIEEFLNGTDPNVPVAHR